MRSFLVIAATIVASSVTGAWAQDNYFRATLPSPIFFSSDFVPEVQVPDEAHGHWREGQQVDIPLDLQHIPAGAEIVLSSDTLQYESRRITGTLEAGLAPDYLRIIEVDVVHEGEVVAETDIDLVVYPSLEISSIGTQIAYVEDDTNLGFPLNGAVGEIEWNLVSGDLVGRGLSFENGHVVGNPFAVGLIENVVVSATDSVDGTTAFSNAFDISIEEMVASATLSGSVSRLDVSTLFADSEWTDGFDKIVLIQEGTTIYSTSTSVAALTIPNTFGGTLRIINEGQILGARGSRGTTGVGGTGGHAVDANGAVVEFVNNGDVWAGGGGGGAGGRGGNGSKITGWSTNVVTRDDPYNGNGCLWSSGKGATRNITARWNNSVVGSLSNHPKSVRTVHFERNGYRYTCPMNNAYTGSGRIERAEPTVSAVSGGAGGYGGYGQGYGYSTATDGVVGSTAANGAGRGGTGGAGGAWGEAGSLGSDGEDGSYGAGQPGRAGGQPGYAFQGGQNMVLTGPGSVKGR